MKTLTLRLTENEIHEAEQYFGCERHIRGFADYFRIFWKTHRKEIRLRKDVNKELVDYLTKCGGILLEAELPKDKKSELIDEMNRLIVKATGNKQTQIIF